MKEKYIKGQVYISCPYSTPIKEVGLMIRALKENTLSHVDRIINTESIKYFERGTRYYSSKDLESSEIFILPLPNNGFLIDNINHLYLGVKKELLLAIELKKKIYIAYKKRNAISYDFYATEIFGNKLAGIAGTSLNIYRELKNISNNTNTYTETSAIKNINKNILLLL